MEKHELDALIQRRFDEGKTLSIYNIIDEEVSYNTIQFAANKYYGSWTNAKVALNCQSSNSLNYNTYGKEEVIIQLKKYADEEKYDYRSGVPCGLIRRATELFGGIKKARKAAEITINKSEKQSLSSDDVITIVNKSIKEGLTSRQAYAKYKGLEWGIQSIFGGLKGLKKSTGISFPRKGRTNEGYRKYSDKELSEFVIECSNNGWSGYESKASNSKLYNACFIKWGNWNKALKANGITPKRATPRNDWTKEELINIYLHEIKSGISRKEISNRGAIYKLFGSVSNLRVEIGLDKPQQAKKILTKNTIDFLVNQALKMDIDKISEQLLDELDENLTYSIKYYYGSTPNYFSTIDIDRYKKPYTSFRWTKENIVWQLKRWIREGYPVNYTAVQTNHKGIIVASRKFFGSYKKAFEYAGLNYEDYRVDTTMASVQGAKFEDILANILTDLEMVYERTPSINGCHPDFVIGEHWIDAKLSEWTVNLADCDTVHKYMPHCKKLTIIYLRKMKEDTIITSDIGFDMIHVSELLKVLPNEKRYKYEVSLENILETLKENEAQLSR